MNLVNVSIVLPAGHSVIKFEMKGPSDPYGIYIDDVFLVECIEVIDN